MEAWSTLCEAEAVHAHQAHFPERRNEYGDWFRDWLDRGLKVSGTDYARAHLHRLASNGKINAAFHDVDVLVCPSMPLLPFAFENSLTFLPVLGHDHSGPRVAILLVERCLIELLECF